MDYVILIITLAFIIIGANSLVSGSVSIAQKLQVSDFIIGALVVGIGTSTPEMVVSVMGAIRGNADIAIGNVVGSNIFNILAILGITAAVFPISVSKSNLRFELPLCIFVSALLLLFTNDFFNGNTGVISRMDGAFLLVLFALFIICSIRKDRMANALQKNEVSEHKTSIWLSLMKIAGGLAALIVGCHYFVESAILIAKKLGVDDAFISITLVAAGTSLPEFAASITAAAKKNTQLALGNVIGSNIFNILLILGLSSVITPLETGGITIIDYIVMTVSAALPALLVIKGKITRFGGVFMLLCYLVYNAWLILN